MSCENNVNFERGRGAAAENFAARGKTPAAVFALCAVVVMSCADVWEYAVSA